MTSERTQLYTTLIKEVLSENKDILDPSQMYMGIQRHVDDAPILGGIEFTEDLSLKFEEGDEKETLDALNIVLTTAWDFVLLFVGAEEAQERFVLKVKEFLEENKDECDDLGIWDYLPDFLKEASSTKETLGVEPMELDENTQVQAFFKELFFNFLEGCKEKVDTDSVVAILNEEFENEHIPADINIDEDGDVEIALESDDLEGVTKALSGAFNSTFAKASELVGDEGCSVMAKMAVERRKLLTSLSFPNAQT